MIYFRRIIIRIKAINPNLPSKRISIQCRLFDWRRNKMCCTHRAAVDSMPKILRMPNSCWVPISLSHTWNCWIFYKFGIYDGNTTSTMNSQYLPSLHRIALSGVICALMECECDFYMGGDANVLDKNTIRPSFLGFGLERIKSEKLRSFRVIKMRTNRMEMAREESK